MNKIILIGNAGQTPELTIVKGDKKVAKFSLAINEYSKNDKGEKITTTQWFNIVAWDFNAENLSKYLKKGQKVYIEGRLVVREYEKDSVKGKSVDVVVQSFEFLAAKTDSDPSEESTKSAPKSNSTPQQQNTPAVPSGDIDESDDLPF